MIPEEKPMNTTIIEVRGDHLLIAQEVRFAVRLSPNTLTSRSTCAERPWCRDQESATAAIDGTSVSVGT